jgi:hypothetical protein
MNAPFEYNLRKLLFRRQFVLGPHFPDAFPWWKRINIGSHLCLTAHPDLNTYHCVSGNKSITLLGYILDPTTPKANDYEIINRLIANLITSDNQSYFSEVISNFGGRWILIVNDGRETKLYNDAMGLRQVFYTNAYFSQGIWCASQPRIIAETLELKNDNETTSEFISSDYYKNWIECIWPGDGTSYKEINHLLPNHYLDLYTGLCHRYWPDSYLEKLPIEDVVEDSSALLDGLIRSAFYRFDLALTITAGWDSRLLLAASKEFSKRIFYYTLWRDGSERDAIIASKLLSKLGLKHNVIKYPPVMDKEFEIIYKRNTTDGPYLWGRMAQGLFSQYPEGKVCVKGNAAEIVRTRFRLPKGREVTAKDLSFFTDFNYGKELASNLYVNSLWGKWLSNLGNIYNVHVLDLFYWEHWGGNFAGLTQTAWDIVQEVFTPYNCRKLLSNMLSLDEKYRDHDQPILFQKMIMKLWPEVLCEPVNPLMHKVTFKSTLKNILLKTHLMQFVPKRNR